MKQIWILLILCSALTLVSAETVIKPYTTGEASLTLGFEPEYLNSGFSFDSEMLFNLDISFDPLEEDQEKWKTDIFFSDFILKLSEEEILYTLPEVNAWLNLSPNLTLQISASPDNSFDWAGPFGKEIDINEDQFLQGTLYDEEDLFLGSAVEVDSYYDAGMVLQYHKDNLEISLGIISADPWGLKKRQFHIDNFSLTAGNGDLLTALELDALETWVDSSAVTNPEGNLYDVVYTEVFFGGTAAPTVLYKVNLNSQGYVELREIEPDGDINFVYSMELGEENSNSYTGSIQVSYTLEDIGLFRIYAIPFHEDRLFSGAGFGMTAEITALPFMGVFVNSDFLLDSTAAEAADKFDYEVALSIPAKLNEKLEVTVSGTASDSGVDDRSIVDLLIYGHISNGDFSGDINYLVTDVLDAAQMGYSADFYLQKEFTQTSLITGVTFDHLLYENTTFEDDYAVAGPYLTFMMGQYSSFSLIYQTGDLLIDQEAGESIGWGLVTLETRIAW